MPRSRPADAEHERPGPVAPFRTRSRVLALVLTSMAVLAAVLVSPPAAQADPAPPVLNESIDDYARYDGADTCDMVERAGAQKLREFVQSSYPGSPGGRILASCSGSSGTSEHHEGRAFDWMVNAYNPEQKAMADDFIDFLLAPDQYGNPNANARRLGIMYMIFNRQMWRAYDPGAGWQPYSGSSPHTDHIHFSLSWDGALLRTSWFTQADLGRRMDQSRYAVAARPGSTRRDEFRRATGGELQHRVVSSDGTTSWENLGGPVSSAPSAAWTSRRTLFVVVRDQAGRLSFRQMDGAGGWGAWQLASSSVVTSAPGVSSSDGRLDLVVRTSTGSVAYRSWTRRGGWVPFVELGGATTSAPSPVSRNDRTLQVFSRGASGALEVVTRTGGRWDDWAVIPGLLASGPAAVSLRKGELSVFARNTNGRMSSRSYDADGWTTWGDLEGAHVSGPAAATDPGRRLDLVARNVDGRQNQKFYRPGDGWSGWSVG